ncbi:MAG: VCBS repeat-containing protein [Candidatus Omnitrophica bacterium]|nr:VCBS repeat-containing protein [Candidatus Omnitrophota bacterium]
MDRRFRMCLIVFLSMATFISSMASGDISLTQGSIFSTGLRSSTIASGDLDGDGDVDLAIANIHSHSVTIAYNDGAGNFTEIVDVPLDEGRKFPIALAIGDLDSYGNLDLALAFVQNLDRTELGTPAQSGIIYFYAEDDGSYTQIYSPVNGIPSCLKIEDLDGDGDSDLLVGNNGEIDVDLVTGSINVVEAGFYYFENKGRGLFSSGNPRITDGSLVDILAFDYNQDDIIDIVGVNQGTTGFDSNFNYIYLDMNISTFQGTENGLTEYDPIWVEYIPWSLDKGDVNNDGLDDIITSNVGDINNLASFMGTNGSLVLFENTGQTFNALKSIPTPGTAFSVLADDYDLDGDVDIIATIQEITDIGGVSRLDASLRVYENDGQANFTETASFYLAEEPRYAVKDDFDNDGDMDIAVLCTILDSATAGNALNGEVYVFYNDAIETDVSSWEIY